MSFLIKKNKLEYKNKDLMERLIYFFNIITTGYKNCNRLSGIDDSQASFSYYINFCHS